MTQSKAATTTNHHTATCIRTKGAAKFASFGLANRNDILSESLMLPEKKRERIKLAHANQLGCLSCKPAPSQLPRPSPEGLCQLKRPFACKPSIEVGPARPCFFRKLTFQSNRFERHQAHPDVPASLSLPYGPPLWSLPLPSCNHHNFQLCNHRLLASQLINPQAGQHHRHHGGRLPGD